MGSTFSRTPFPYRLPSLTNISPFSYRDGTTYLQILEILRAYIQEEFVPEAQGVFDGFHAEYNKALDAVEKAIEGVEHNIIENRAEYERIQGIFVDAVREQVNFINNKTGVADIQRVILTEDYTLEINPLWPTNHPVEFVFTQDAVGGHGIVEGENITGSVEFNLAPGSFTRLALIPSGEGKWYVSQSPATLAELRERVEGVYLPDMRELQEEVDRVLTETTKTVQADLDLVRTNSADNGYLFAAFVGNGATGEHLNLFYSPDGKTLFGDRSANPVYIPADGGGLRDPSIIYRNNRWYVAYTSKDGQNKDMAIASSVTGAKGTWSLVTKISATSLSTLNKLWAPEFIEDGDDLYIFFTSITAGNVGSMAYMKALNTSLTAWSAPAPLTWAKAPADTYIDGVPVKGKDGKWYMFYSGGQSIDRAVADTIDGPWTVDRTGNWAGWGNGVEGPTLVRDGDMFRAYFDRYVENTGLHWSEATDLNGPWSAPVKLATAPLVLGKGQTIRHGSVMKLAEPVARNKATAAVSMRSTGGNHTEFYNGQGSIINRGAFATLQDNLYDDNETTNYDRVTYDPASQNFRLNEYCMYSISAVLHIGSNGGSVVTNVTRGLADLTQGENVNIVHARGSGGVEDKIVVSLPNFKPRYAGEEVKFRMLAEWGGGDTAKMLTRIRFTKVGEV